MNGRQAPNRVPADLVARSRHYLPTGDHYPHQLTGICGCKPTLRLHYRNARVCDWTWLHRRMEPADEET